nr:unknown [Picea sitchensis]
MALRSVSVAKPSFSVNAISNAYCKPGTMDSPPVKIVSVGDSRLFGTKISTPTIRPMPARTFQTRRMIAVAKVSKGSVPPSFNLKDQDGRLVSLSKFKGKPVVLYFYPADESPGCTKEACAFRDSYE